MKPQATSEAETLSPRLTVSKKVYQVLSCKLKKASTESSVSSDVSGGGSELLWPSDSISATLLAEGSKD